MATWELKRQDHKRCQFLRSKIVVFLAKRRKQDHEIRSQHCQFLRSKIIAVLAKRRFKTDISVLAQQDNSFLGKEEIRGDDRFLA